MPKITKLSPTEFQFEYSKEEDAQELEEMKQFEFEGNIYIIRKAVPGFETPGYYSFLISVL